MKKFEELETYQDFTDFLQERARLPFPKEITPRSDVLAAALDDPALHGMLVRWQRGEFTWEQALNTFAVFTVRQ